MRKKKFIALMMCLMASCAGVGIFSACGDGGSETSGTSSSDSSVQTPVSIEYKVTFDANGGSSVKAQYIIKGEKAKMPTENPTREGYTFVEWQLNGNTYDFDAPVIKDITLKAKWTKNEATKFVVSFVVDGEVFYTTEVAKDKKVIAPAEIPTREGYAFDCWTLNGEAYDFETPVTEEITLEAKWANLWTVTFDAGEEQPFHTVEVADGAKVTAPIEVPTREGYVFDCWTLNGEAYDFETPVTQALTLEVKWANAWTVTFEVGAGTPIAPVMVKDGGCVSAPETTKEGYYVTGWLLDGANFDFATPITGNVTLTAVWTTDGLYSNQIGIRIYGNEVSGQDKWIIKETGENGEIIIKANFQADATYSPALVLREIFAKDYYQNLIDNGYTSITFNLAIEGDVSDLYVFGKPVTNFKVNEGVYKIVVNLAHIVTHYDTIYALATSDKQAGQASSLSAKFITWKSPAGDWASARNYVFTISDVKVDDTVVSTFDINFAAGSTDTVKVGEKTTLRVETNVEGEIAWSSSDETIATVVGGVVTGVKAGEVVITATLGDLTASKTIYVKAPEITYNNQIGARICGNDVSANQNYVKVVTENGETVITAKFQADATYAPALILKNLADKAAYEGLIAEGKEILTFNLAIDGDVSDLYVFGKALDTFENVGGVYTVEIEMQQIVYYYDTIYALATSKNQAGQASSLAAKFIAWKSPAGDWASARNYVFTISDVEMKAKPEVPTFDINFAAGSADTIKVGEKTTLCVETNVEGEIAWSSSDETIATVVGGVVTGIKAGEVTITATLGDLTASKTIYVKAPEITYNNQIGIRIYGNDLSQDKSYLDVATGDNGQTVITAKFQADATYAPALIIKNLAEKAAYEGLIAEGKEILTFKLMIDGDVSDLYVFGKALSNLPEENGVYTVEIEMQQIVYYYDTIYALATSKNQAGQASSLAAKFIAWKSPAGDWASVRNYVFTISDVEMKAKPEEPTTIDVAFANDCQENIYIGETTTIVATTNKNVEDIVWSSSDETIATVENGVVTGVKAGEAVITATIDGVSASMTVYVKAPVVTYNNQIGIRIYGNDLSQDKSYLDIATGASGETVITAKFQADATYSPALVIKNMADKAVYEQLIADGYTTLTFSLKVEGDMSDLYVFGKKVTSFAKNAEDVYAIVVDVQQIVYYYDTINTIATSTSQVGKESSMAAKFITWKSPAGDWSTVRNYTFTISNAAVRQGVLFSDDIGMRVNGWDMTTNTTYMEMDVAADGAMTITANWQAHTNYYPSLVLKNIETKDYYQSLKESGYEYLTFDLKVDGADADKLDDIYVLGGIQLSGVEKVDGVYKLKVQLAHIIEFYETISALGTSTGQAGQTGSRSAMFIAWRFAAGSEGQTRNYVFTISNAAFTKSV